MRCDSVLCCRMSPGQKAQVKFFSFLNKPVQIFTPNFPLEDCEASQKEQKEADDRGNRRRSQRCVHDSRSSRGHWHLWQRGTKRRSFGRLRFGKIQVSKASSSCSWVPLLHAHFPVGSLLLLQSKPIHLNQLILKFTIWVTNLSCLFL
jgi:hypothetical protein